MRLVIGIARRPARHLSSCRLWIQRNKGRQKRFLGGHRYFYDQITFGADVAIYERDVTKSIVIKSLLNVMHDVSRITGNPIDDIWVYLCNLAPTDMVEYGRVLPRPGEEEQWFILIASVVAQRVSREPRCPSRDFSALTLSMRQASCNR